jgi:hypothetical protein
MVLFPALESSPLTGEGRWAHGLSASPPLAPARGVAMLDPEEFLSETRESPPCGPNLEHDLAFFELEEAARGKLEQRVGDAVKPAEDPNWPKVVELAQALLLRTKDLRVAVHGPKEFRDSLPNSVSSTACSSAYWDRLYPLLEADNSDDPTERLNAVAPLADPETLIKDLRAINLVNSREHGQLQARDVEGLGVPKNPHEAAAWYRRALGSNVQITQPVDAGPPPKPEPTAPPVIRLTEPRLVAARNQTAQMAIVEPDIGRVVIIGRVISTRAIRTLTVNGTDIRAKIQVPQVYGGARRAAFSGASVPTRCPRVTS